MHERVFPFLRVMHKKSSKLFAVAGLEFGHGDFV